MGVPPPQIPITTRYSITANAAPAGRASVGFVTPTTFPLGAGKEEAAAGKNIRRS